MYADNSKNSILRKKRPENISIKKQASAPHYFLNASDDLRISTSHETNGQAYLRKESPHWL